MMRIMMSPSTSGGATAGVPKRRGYAPSDSPAFPRQRSSLVVHRSVSEPAGQADHALHDEHEDEHGGDQDARHGGDAHVEHALHHSPHANRQHVAARPGQEE